MQQGLCALCGCTVTQSACELDHVVPVRQLFADSVQRLQALCVDCHSEKTLRESAQPTSLESRVCPGVMEAYVRSPKLPPLVFEAQGSHREKPYVGVDVVRCRHNGLANAPFPLPILCPADGVEPVEPGRLPDLGYVEGCRDARQAALQLLPFVGPGWYPKVSIAAMLETGVCRWDHIPLGIYARGHVGAATLRRALKRMDAAWPEGEEHMAKLSVNAMIGLWARRADVIYSVRSSSCQLDGPGADFTQSFCYGEGSVWDFVYTRRLRNVSPHPRRRAGLRALHGGQGPAAAGGAPTVREAGQDGLPTAPAPAKEPAREPGGADQAAAPGRHTRLSGGGV